MSLLDLSSWPHYRRIFLSFLCANAWTIILTTIPVVIKIKPNNYYAGHPNWYTGNDVIRYIEPVGGLPLNFWILLESQIFLRLDKKPLNVFIVFLFMLSAAVYQQGAGFHSASNMIKNAITSALDIHNDDTLQSVYYWVRNVWEHIVSHYMYAAGLAFMQFTYAFAYKDFALSSKSLHFTHPKPVAILEMNTAEWFLLFSAATVYAFLIAIVAAQFPSGNIVGLIYTIVYGIVFIGGLLYHQCKGTVLLSEIPIEMSESQRLVEMPENNKLSQRFSVLIQTIKSRPVLLYFFFSYALALVLILIWIGINNGLADRNSHNAVV